MKAQIGSIARDNERTTVQEGISLITASGPLFEAYVALRMRVFQAEYPFLPSDFGREDAADQVSDIAVCVRGDRVVAGARLTISQPGRRRIMPIQGRGICLEEFAPVNELQLHRRAYGELSRLAADANLSEGFKASLGLGDFLGRVAAGYGADLVFCLCPRAHVRLYEMNTRRRGAEFRNFGPLPLSGDPRYLCAFLGLQALYGRSEKKAA